MSKNLGTVGISNIHDYLNENNRFLDIIREKSTCKGIINKFKYKGKLKNFIHEFMTTSPDFITLWEMASFIKMAEKVFFYNNNIDAKLFSAKSYQKDTNGFKINNGDVCITIKLFRKYNNVMMEIDRTKCENSKTMLEFKENNWVGEPTTTDEMMLERAIEIIDHEFVTLFAFCYKSVYFPSNFDKMYKSKMRYLKLV